MNGYPTGSIEAWRTECIKHGLIDPASKPDSARAKLSKYKLELIVANRIAANETMAWILT
jgi:hypothetical protein